MRNAVTAHFTLPLRAKSLASALLRIGAVSNLHSMKSYNIAVIGGDGTGPEVVREAIKVLDVAAKKFDLKLNYTEYDLGGARYLKTGEALPDSMLAACVASPH